MALALRAKTIFTSLAVFLALMVGALAPFAQEKAAEPAAPTTQAPSEAGPKLDYEFFKTRVEPIFLKKRSADHARCYVCHQIAHHGDRPFQLEMLASGTSFWTEEQSRHNFEVVSNLVVPGKPLSSLLLLMPMAPEAGGLADTHQGGRQFASQDDPDWKTLYEWVNGKKAGGS